MFCAVITQTSSDRPKKAASGKYIQPAFTDHPSCSVRRCLLIRQLTLCHIEAAARAASSASRAPAIPVTFI